jgi:hypothetical protein
MRILKVIERRIRHKGDGIDLASDVSSVIAMNVGEGSSVTPSSTHQVIRQVNGRSRKGPPNRKAGERLVKASLAIPVNAAVAANLLSDGSTTGADAIADDQITQRNN